MARTPVALGLTLCDCVIVEAMTHKVSLIGCLTEMVMNELPGLAEPFSVLAFLSGAQGTIDLDLILEEPNAGEAIGSWHMRIYSPGPLSLVYCHYPIVDCFFEQSGAHTLSLFANGELIALRRVRIAHRGGTG